MSLRVCNRSQLPLRGWLFLTLVCAGIAGGKLEAQAEPAGGNVDQASTHFDRGVAYYDDGDYHAALIEFQRAYKLQPAYQLLYNLGQVASELRDYAGAEQYFSRYLEGGKHAIPEARRAEVSAELERLKERIASLQVSTNVVGAVIRVDDRVIEHPEAGPVRVSAGRRQLVAEKPGYLPVRRNIDVLGGEVLNLSLKFGPAIAQTRPAETQEQSSAVPWITGIGSGVLLAGAGVVGYSAQRDASEYHDALNRQTTQSELDQLSSSARTKALVSDVMWITGIVGGVVTLVLVLTEDHEQRPPVARRGVSFEF